MLTAVRIAAGTLCLLLAHQAIAAGCDTNAGQKAFQNKCAACHALDKDQVGPHLSGIVGRPMGAVQGYAYSAGLAGAGQTWNLERLDQWLTAPARMIPDTNMAFGGLRNADERKAVLCYLQSQS